MIRLRLNILTQLFLYKYLLCIYLSYYVQSYLQSLLLQVPV